MSNYRTIKSAYEEVKALDPNTALTEYRIRQVVTSGEIPSRKAGAKYIFSLDDLMNYFETAEGAR